MARNAAWNFICFQNTSTESFSQRSSSKNLRLCYRKGCANRFSPHRRYQKFCNDPICASELRRWQALKRQRRHRVNAENRQKHAERERQRRLRKAQAANQPSGPNEPHDSEIDNCAWSRTTNIPKDFCDRPGCYEATRSSHRNQAKYCSNACRQAVHGVRDRNRKWRARRLKSNRKKRKRVGNYGGFPLPRLSFSHSHGSDNHHAQTNSSSRPRPPPAEW